MAFWDPGDQERGSKPRREEAVDEDQRSLFDAVPSPPTLSGLREQAQLPIKECPCCGASNKVYKRKLSSTMAATMCAISTLGEEGEWVHLNRIPRRFIHGGEVAQLQHWALLEQKRNDNTRKRRSGMWRLTPKGYAFVRRKLRVPSHAFVCAPGDRLLGWEITTTGVVEALGNQFDYQELMRGD